MFQSLPPGLHVSRVRQSPVELPRIDVPAFIGLAERGPLGAVDVVDGWPDFVAKFGDFQDWAYLAFSARACFDNGATRIHVLRVAAPPLETETSGAQPADGSASVLAATDRVRVGARATLVQHRFSGSNGVQPADRRSSVLVNVAGFVAGEMAIVRQGDAAPIRLEIVAVDAATQSLRWSRALPDGLDITQPFEVSSTSHDARLVAEISGATVTWSRPLDGRFDTAARIHVGFGAGVASGFAYDETGAPLLSVEAASAGLWGDRVSARMTATLSPGYTSRLRSVPDDASHVALDRVDGLAPGSFVTLAQEGAPAHRSLIAAVNAQDRVVTLRTALAGFDLPAAADGSKPITLQRHSFEVSVFEDQRLVEIYRDLDLPTPEEPSASPVNSSSRRVRITRLPGTEAAWLDPVSEVLEAGLVRLHGGRDGTAMLQQADVTGAGGLGLFDDRAEPAALAIPDIHQPERAAVVYLPEDLPEPDPCALCPEPTETVPPQAHDLSQEASPGFSRATIEAIQRAMVDHCEVRGDRVALLDPPITPGGACVDWPELIAWRQGFSSSYAVAYVPWIDLPDPLGATGRALRRVPPSGHALGQFAAADAEPGRAAPANRVLAWASATACPIDDTRHAWLNERGLNAITRRGGRGIRIMGARTLSPDPDWQQLTVRRLFIRLKRAIRYGLAWAAFEPANARFEAQVVAMLEAMMEREWQAGRLRGRRAEEAFQIGVSRTAADHDQGRFPITIAVAPTLPAEFVFLRLVFTRDAMDLAELTPAGGGLL